MMNVEAALSLRSRSCRNLAMPVSFIPSTTTE
jgi:hypothetical protein